MEIPPQTVYIGPGFYIRRLPPSYSDNNSKCLNFHWRKNKTEVLTPSLLYAIFENIVLALETLLPWKQQFLAAAYVPLLLNSLSCEKEVSRVMLILLHCTSLGVVQLLCSTRQVKTSPCCMVVSRLTCIWYVQSPSFNSSEDVTLSDSSTPFFSQVIFIIEGKKCSTKQDSMFSYSGSVDGA